MFITDYLGTRWRNLSIRVDIDPLLLTGLDCADKTTTQRVININLYKLIYSIGTIQSRRWAPSNRQKFIDKSDLIEFVQGNTNEFRIRIDETQTFHGPETLTKISEDFGVGVSIMVMNSLYNIRQSTIQKIPGTARRADWDCQTYDNRVIAVECKGSSSQNGSNTQLRRALRQKAAATANIKIASLTIIKENEMTSNRIIDPPSEDDDMSPELRRQVLRAGHYSTVFSFLGHSALSRYFTQMKKRLLSTITPAEQGRKERTFRDLRDRYSHVQYNNRTYTGTFTQINDSDYLFVGVDISLISFIGFQNFQDYEESRDEELEENHYILFQDGILVIEIKSIRAFTDNVAIPRIKNYQDNITMSDIDEMSDISFTKYLSYILRSNNFTIIEQPRYQTEPLSEDILVDDGNRTFGIEIKVFKTKKVPRLYIDRLRQISVRSQQRKMVLITNVNFNFTNLDIPNLTVIGRDQLNIIIKDPRLLPQFLGS